MIASAGANSNVDYVQTAQRASIYAQAASSGNGDPQSLSSTTFAELSAKYNQYAADQAQDGGNTTAAQTLYAKAGTNYALSASKYFNLAHQCAERGDKAGAAMFMDEAKENSMLSKDELKQGIRLGGPMAGALKQMYKDSSIMASQTKSVDIPPTQSYSKAGENMMSIVEEVKAQQPAIPSDQKQQTSGQNSIASSNQYPALEKTL